MRTALEHERHRWQQPDGVDGDAVGQLVAALTLIGGASISDAERRADALGVASALSTVRDLYERPGESTEAWLPGLEPDPLGEALVHQVLSRLDDPAAWLEPLLDRTEDVLTVLTRLARWEPSGSRWLRAVIEGRLDRLSQAAMAVAIETGALLGIVLGAVFAKEGDLALAEQLAPHLPEVGRTVALRELAAAVAEVRWRAAPVGEDEEALAERALRAGQRGNRLSELGRHEDALDATQQAVDIRRKLAQARPDAFLPDLATSLGAYGQALRAAGRDPEAQTSFLEGIEHLAAPFQALPAAFAGLMGGLVHEYLATCDATGSEPERTVLAPISVVLNAR